MKSAIKRYLRKMNPPTEISRQDILRVALARLGDNANTWEYLKPLGISRPPQRKFSFVVSVEVRNTDTPETWRTGNLGRAMYNESRPTKIEKVEDVSEKVEDLNTGTVSVEDFLKVAKHIKKAERYCPDFWDVVERELNVPRPSYPKVNVSLTITPEDFQRAGIEPDVEITPSVLRSVFGEMADEGNTPDNLRVETVATN